LGIHVTDNHFYEPVPDTRLLPERLWEQPSEMPGVDFNDAAQVALLKEFAEGYRAEYEAFPSQPTGRPADYHLDNPMFAKVDAEILYCMVRQRKPRRVIEIGSGNSTKITTLALERNAAQDPSKDGSVVAIEPYPSDVLLGGLPRLEELIVKPVQEVPLSLFDQLSAGDILFIDSSHVLKIGSDVQYEFLEIVPRVAPGVAVHVHDVFLPAEYPRHMVMDWHRFWTEQYLLQAFLAFNSAFSVLWGSMHMHLAHPEELDAAFPSYRREGWPTGLPPCSFWMERVA
jgi:predicted O-methyltransferase YrrM